MTGRDRGNYERIVALAHQVEAMARQKTLKPLAAYLAKPKAKKAGGASEVLAMLTRMKKKQDAKGTPDG
jgi:hypothetical protein